MMLNMQVKYALVRDVTPPIYGTAGSAGLDFFVPNHFEEVGVAPGCSVVIPSGIKMILPEGTVLIAYNKSGIATKTGLIVGACVVDSDYRGEIHLHVFNAGLDVPVIKPGMKLCQFILVPYIHADLKYVDSIIEDTARGAGGFGSTGA